MPRSTGEIAGEARQRPWTTGGRPRLRDTALRLLAGIALVLAAAGPVSAASTQIDASPTWSRHLVDRDCGDSDTFDLGATSTAVDPAGRSVMLYGCGPNTENGFDLRLARGPTQRGHFHISRIDPTDPLKTGYASLALGPRGRAYASYVDGVFLDQGTLRFAVHRRAGWEVRTVDANMPVVRTGIALDSHNRPVIAYTRGVNQQTQLWMATRRGGAWHTSMIAQIPIVLFDLAMSPTGDPEIAYIYNTDLPGNLYEAGLAKLTAAGWSFQDVGFVSTPGIDFGISLSIEASGAEDVAYTTHDPTQGIMYARHTPTGWTHALVSPGDLRWPQLAADSGGHLYATFYDATIGALKFARLVDGSWLVSTIADNPSETVRVGRMASIAIDRYDRARVTYFVGDEFSGTTLHAATSSPLV